MNRNLSGLLIGCVGAPRQTVVTSTQCVAAGFCVLRFGLLVKEGIISL
jgi:hypothetical protein